MGNFTLKSRKVQLIQNFFDVEEYDDYVKRFGTDEKQCAEVGIIGVVIGVVIVVIVVVAVALS